MEQTRRTFADAFDDAIRTAQEYREHGGDQALEALAEHLEAIENDARESLQARYFELYSAIADKLESGMDLSADERRAVQILIAGAGEYYIGIENNVEEWKRELERIMSELLRLRQQGIDTASELMQVQALCRDAETVLPDLLRYSQEQGRIERARQSLSGSLDAENGAFLGRVIRDMLASEHR